MRGCLSPRALVFSSLITAACLLAPVLAGTFAQRPRVCKASLTGEPVDAQAPNCQEVTAGCNSPAFLWANRPG